MIAPEAGLSISRQCTLVGIARSSFYYREGDLLAQILETAERLWQNCNAEIEQSNSAASENLYETRSDLHALRRRWSHVAR
jgi:hypothetical protein